MHFNLVKISVIALLLVVESHGGLIDGVYGRIKNTTTGLKQDVKNAWSYSKSLVGQEPEANQNEEERGLIGGMVHSAHEKMHSLHEQLWAVEDIPNDSGLLWNMYNRLKQRLAKAKHFILGDGGKPVENSTQPPNEEAIIIKDTMDKLFNADGTRKVDEDTFAEAVENLRKRLNEMRNKSEANTPVQHGEGIIDIRMNVVRDDFENNVEHAAGVDNDVYDKVYDNVQAANDNINKVAENGMETIKSGLSEVSEKGIELKDKVSDSAAKEKNLFEASYNAVNQEARNVGDGVKKSVDEMQRLS